MIDKTLFGPVDINDYEKMFTDPRALCVIKWYRELKRKMALSHEYIMKLERENNVLKKRLNSIGLSDEC